MSSQIKFNSITVEETPTHLWVTGKTFPLRQQLRSLEGYWSPTRARWEIPISYKEVLFDFLKSTVSVPSEPPIEEVPGLETIPVVDSIPSRVPKGFGVFNLSGQFVVCGSQATAMKSRIEKLGGVKHPSLNCWILPPSKVFEVLKQKEERRRIASLQREEKDLLRLERVTREGRLKIQETEADFTSNLEKVDPEDRQERFWELVNQDVSELKSMWKETITILSKQSERYVTTVKMTYSGHIKPPDEAFIYAARDWRYDQGHIQRVDFKIYEVKFDID